MIEIRQSVHSNLMAFRGSSGEDKPMTCAPGSTFYEWDTSSGYMFDGEEWLLQTSGGGGGGASFGQTAYFVICEFSGGAPDVSTASGGVFTFFASASDLTDHNPMVAAVSGDPSGGEPPTIAAGVIVSVIPNAQIAEADTIKLYLLNMGTSELTELPDEVTGHAYGGYLTSIDFTMPVTTGSETVLLGYESSGGGGD